MVLPADLYTLVRFYANKIHNSRFTVSAFSIFIEKYAKRFSVERPELTAWSQDTERKVKEGLPGLAETGKIELGTSEKGTTIHVPQFYQDVLQQVYRKADETPELPFPDEVSMKLIFPPAQLRTISLDLDFTSYLNNPQSTPLPILKLIFPEGSGLTYALSGMIPKRLLELAVLKARHWLRARNNKEYVLHKLTPAFHGKEGQLKDAINMLLMRPSDTIREIEQAGDFSYQFWAYFSSLVKNDIRKKNDLLHEDTAALQSIFLIELMSNYYKGLMQKQKDEEMALKSFESQLEKAPFYYTMDDILRFKDHKGNSLLGLYSREAMEDRLKELTTSGDMHKLSELLIIHDQDDTRLFVKKGRILHLLVKLLGETRPKVKTALSQRWYKLLIDYRSEDAMNDEAAFNRLLLQLAQSICPLLIILLQDPKLMLVYEEMETSGNGVPEASKLFYRGALVPMSELFLLSRKSMKTDVQVLLPFWYTLPVFSQVLAFFHKMFSAKPPKTPRKESRKIKNIEQEEQVSVSTETSKKRRQQLREAAGKIEQLLVPKGETAESYVKTQRDLWNRLINPQAKDDLTEDVNALIRDYLRRTIRSLRAAAFTPERIRALAETLADAPSLQQLPNQEALIQYIQLYIISIIKK